MHPRHYQRWTVMGYTPLLKSTGAVIMRVNASDYFTLCVLHTPCAFASFNEFLIFHNVIVR